VMSTGSVSAAFPLSAAVGSLPVFWLVESVPGPSSFGTGTVFSPVETQIDSHLYV